MVVRELYSNALDEQGSTSVQSGPLQAAVLAGHTAITLRGDCFLQVWNDRHRYFLANEQKVHGSAFVDAYDSLGHNHTVFYRGIKVYDTQKPTLYRYNLLENVTLTEDRTLRYTWHLNEAIEKAIITSRDPAFIGKMLTAGDGSYESGLTFFESYANLTLSDEFKVACRKLTEKKPRNVNKAALRWYQNRTQMMLPLVPARLTKVQQVQLAKAIEFIKQIGFGDELDRYPVEVVNWLGEGHFGKAEDDKIILCKDCFDRGTKFVASTILEEFVHNRYGLADESRDLQTWLFDRLITMGEEFVTGEPL
jgi:hypothetical protein